ncbi:hypothetical protein N7447_003214 [Penicillium robsamsonii]|uniref:uncharacterized protein n=1 Tax=Penicillium robsamsonii TaxID=1792511 RepID=UPI0025465BFB|nr:uncharacterized protein N7447_003214 [Penicillium robsamsonii]KAJ5837188.1 hypothetical protein N7447_003214 [Penicillium robsamsonii]
MVLICVGIMGLSPESRFENRDCGCLQLISGKCREKRQGPRAGRRSKGLRKRARNMRMASTSPKLEWPPERTPDEAKQTMSNSLQSGSRADLKLPSKL